MSSKTDNTESDNINKLKYRIDKTCKIRFLAGVRLKVESFFHMLLITSISILLIYITLDTSHEVPKAVNILISVIVISFSLIIYGIDPSKKSQLLYLCAMELKELLNTIELNIETEDTKIENIAKRYYSIINKYNINHDEIDYEYIEHKNKKDKFTGNCWKSYVWWVWWWFIRFVLFLWLYKFVIIDIMIVGIVGIVVYFIF